MAAQQQQLAGQPQQPQQQQLQGQVPQQQMPPHALRGNAPRPVAVVSQGKIVTLSPSRKHFNQDLQVLS